MNGKPYAKPFGRPFHDSKKAMGRASARAGNLLGIGGAERGGVQFLDRPAALRINAPGNQKMGEKKPGGVAGPTRRRLLEN
jgi:hypothetical protein